MTTVAEVASWMEKFAPKGLAESWDNVGLLWGDPASAIDRVMTCLTVTPDSADEAVERGCGLIVSHHPILFRPVQQIRADRAETGFLWRLARAGVAIYSPHTAFDNSEGGINDGLANRLGLSEVRPLRRMAADPAFKVVAFTPETDHEAVIAAAFAAGAGRIGAYEECSFSAEGIGTFLGLPGSNPAVGRPGNRERAPERKVEFLCPGNRLDAVLAAIRKAHSYEEPAIDVYSLHKPGDGPGSGRIGRVEPTTLDHFTRKVKEALGVRHLQVVGDPSREIQKVAIACGAGDDFLKDAARKGADLFLTGEARFHRLLEAESLGVAMILPGHYATERPGVEDLAGRLASAFPHLEIWPSRREHDPFTTA